MPKLHIPITVQVRQLKAAPWNVNEMNDTMFNKLVQSIEEDGFREPVHVVPLDKVKDEKGEEIQLYRIVGGHHRIEAAKVAGMDEVTAIVLSAEEYDEDVQKLQSVKLNMIKGKISSTKFTKMYLELSEKYTEDMLAEMMAFENEEQMMKLVKDVKKALPEDMRDKFKHSEKEIKTVDDLSTIINRIFNDHGDTVEKNFIFFNFGGRTHLLIEMNKELKEVVTQITDHCKEDNKDVNDVLMQMLSDTKNVSDIAKGTLPPTPDESKNDNDKA